MLSCVTSTRRHKWTTPQTMQGGHRQQERQGTRTKELRQTIPARRNHDKAAAGPRRRRCYVPRSRGRRSKTSWKAFHATLRHAFEGGHTSTATQPPAPPTATTVVFELMNHIFSGCLFDFPSRLYPHHSCETGAPKSAAHCRQRSLDSSRKPLRHGGLLGCQPVTCAPSIRCQCAWWEPVSRPRTSVGSVLLPGGSDPAAALA
jgi:hypothetical protein